MNEEQDKNDVNFWEKVRTNFLNKKVSIDGCSTVLFLDIDKEGNLTISTEDRKMAFMQRKNWGTIQEM